MPLAGLRAVAALSTILVTTTAHAQIHLMPDKARREALEREAHIERMVMVPMRDGVQLASRVYLPKQATGLVPAIFWRSPYNFSEQMVPRPDYPDANLKFALDAIRHGYAFVMQNERGKFFSEGTWEILGHPRTDGYDALTWIARQSWSNGKVGTIGCSSTAEWIMGLASQRHPAHKAAVPMAQGAGIGRMGPYFEQGNFYHGGAIQLPMMAWLYGEQNLLRPVFPSVSREELVRVSKYYDLAPSMPPVDWLKAARHLPVRDAIVAAGGPGGVFETFADRMPDDPAWYRGGLYHDNEDFHVPALWVNSWYDLSVGPNLELYRHARRKASDASVRAGQYLVVAPTEHCHMYRLRSPHVVGERDMGVVDFGLDDIVWRFLDHHLKEKPRGEARDYARTEPRVRYFAMGANQWRTAEEWPPPGARRVTLYLSSEQGANTLSGDGQLVERIPGAGADEYRYDPMNPVPTRGGNFCCLGDTIKPGSFDQRPTEARADVLVYTGPVLAKPIEVTGPIEVLLHVSSDAPDTDFTVKLVDVAPDGTAWNLDETIQRVRYREGYAREVFMQPGQVYPLKLGPLNTSNVFLAGHRVRIEVSSSNFPRFERNLNTGGRNARESEARVALNRVHHGAEHPSHIVLTVVDRP